MHGAYLKRLYGSLHEVVACSMTSSRSSVSCTMVCFPLLIVCNMCSGRAYCVVGLLFHADYFELVRALYIGTGHCRISKMYAVSFRATATGPTIAVICLRRRITCCVLWKTGNIARGLVLCCARISVDDCC